MQIYLLLSPQLYLRLSDVPWEAITHTLAQSPIAPGPLLYNQCLPNICLKQYLFSSDLINAFLEVLLMTI